MTNSPISPYGGALVDLLVDSEQRDKWLQKAPNLPVVDLNERATCDLELLATGAFSPLRTFLGREDYEGVRDSMRLADGTLWPIPIALHIPDSLELRVGDPLALRGEHGVILAVLETTEIFEYDKEKEALGVFGTKDKKHPGVAALYAQGERYVSGPLHVLQLPTHFDYPNLRRTPAQVRAEISQRGWQNVVAFQTRNPLHRAHEELTKRAARQIGGGLLLHPVVGVTKPGDVDHYTRVRCYSALVDNHYDAKEVVLSLLPLAMRMAGPREALWHAIIRRNHGVTHLIIGRDHAGPGVDSQGKPFYGPYDAQELMRQHEGEIGVAMVPFQMVVYLPDKQTYVPVDEVPDGASTANISGTQVRDDYLAKGTPLPEWFSRPEVAAILGEANPPRYRQGFALWLSGTSDVSGAMLARGLEQQILSLGRRVTVLDYQNSIPSVPGVRGWEDAAFLAARLVEQGGVVIVARQAPPADAWESIRQDVGNVLQVALHTSAAAAFNAQPGQLDVQVLDGQVWPALTAVMSHLVNEGFLQR